MFVFRIGYTAKTTKALHTSTKTKTQQFPKTLRAREKRRRAEAAAAPRSRRRRRKRNGEKEPNCRAHQHWVPPSACRLLQKEEDSKYVLHGPRRSVVLYACRPRVLPRSSFTKYPNLSQKIFWLIYERKGRTSTSCVRPFAYAGRRLLESSRYCGVATTWKDFLVDLITTNEFSLWTKLLLTDG